MSSPLSSDEGPTVLLISLANTRTSLWWMAFEVHTVRPLTEHRDVEEEHGCRQDKQRVTGVFAFGPLRVATRTPRGLCTTRAAQIAEVIARA